MTYRPLYRVLIHFEHLQHCKLYQITGECMDLVTCQRKNLELDQVSGLFGKRGQFVF